MKLNDFDYPLPKELIAQFPLEKRDESRLMVIDRATDAISVNKFYNISDHLDEGDLLVINDTKVFPARIFGKKNTGGAVELLLLKELEDADDDRPVFTALKKCSKRLKAGQRIYFDGDMTAEVLEPLSDGRVKVRFSLSGDMYDALDKIGVMPLPPYIKREGKENAQFDKGHYQTVYAKRVGAIAAPTAGFHFTKELLDKLQAKGIKIASVTLHVGLGTFLPVRSENVLEHKMHEEFFSVTDECVKEIEEVKRRGGRVVAVGTTSMRALESAFDDERELTRKEGDTRLFIYPGYKFKIVDAMITNFHLPKSTLLMLVSAFAGTDLIKRAYDMAVKESFRFFSYGDAMFIA